MDELMNSSLVPYDCSSSDEDYGFDGDVKESLSPLTLSREVVNNNEEPNKTESDLSPNRPLTPTPPPTLPEWSRVVTPDTLSVYYISPSGTVILTSVHLTKYLKQSENCQCGIESIPDLGLMFNFDPDSPMDLGSLISSSNACQTWASNLPPKYLSILLSKAQIHHSREIIRDPAEVTRILLKQGLIGLSKDYPNYREQFREITVHSDGHHSVRVLSRSQLVHLTFELFHSGVIDIEDEGHPHMKIKRSLSDAESSQNPGSSKAGRKRMKKNNNKFRKMVLKPKIGERKSLQETTEAILQRLNLQIDEQFDTSETQSTENNENYDNENDNNENDSQATEFEVPVSLEAKVVAKSSPKKKYRKVKTSAAYESRMARQRKARKEKLAAETPEQRTARLAKQREYGRKRKLAKQQEQQQQNVSIVEEVPIQNVVEDLPAVEDEVEAVQVLRQSPRNKREKKKSISSLQGEESDAQQKKELIVQEELIVNKESIVQEVPALRIGNDNDDDNAMDAMEVEELKTEELAKRQREMSKSIEDTQPQNKESIVQEELIVQQKGMIVGQESILQNESIVPEESIVQKVPFPKIGENARDALEVEELNTEELTKRQMKRNKPIKDTQQQNKESIVQQKSIVPEELTVQEDPPVCDNLDTDKDDDEKDEKVEEAEVSIVQEVLSVQKESSVPEESIVKEIGEKNIEDTTDKDTKEQEELELIRRQRRIKKKEKKKKKKLQQQQQKQGSIGQKQSIVKKESIVQEVPMIGFNVPEDTDTTMEVEEVAVVEGIDLQRRKKKKNKKKRGTKQWVVSMVQEESIVPEVPEIGANNENNKDDNNDEKEMKDELGVKELEAEEMETNEDESIQWLNPEELLAVSLVEPDEAVEELVVEEDNNELQVLSSSFSEADLD